MVRKIIRVLFEVGRFAVAIFKVEPIYRLR